MVETFVMLDQAGLLPHSSQSPVSPSLRSTWTLMLPCHEHELWVSSVLHVDRRMAMTPLTSKAQV